MDATERKPTIIKQIEAPAVEIITDADYDLPFGFLRGPDEEPFVDEPEEREEPQVPTLKARLLRLVHISSA